MPRIKRRHFRNTFQLYNDGAQSCLVKSVPFQPPLCMPETSESIFHSKVSANSRVKINPISHKKEWNSAICSNMDGPRDSRLGWSKSDRERRVLCEITHVWSLIKKDTKRLIRRTETVSAISRPDLWLCKRKCWVEGCIGRLGLACTHNYIQNRLVTGTCCIAWGNPFSALWWPIWGKNLKRNGYICICICMADSLCCIPEINSL